MSDPTKVSRRLVAVFAADVEGYSRLMGADEVGALKQVRLPRYESKKTSGPSSGGFRLTSALLCLLFLGFRLLGRLLWGFLG